MVVALTVGLLLAMNMATSSPAWAADEEVASEDEEDAIPLNPVMVQEGKSKDGSAEDGYLVETVKQVGPWGELPLQDTPYSMSVVSKDLIQNTGAQTYRQILAFIPQIQNMGKQDSSVSLGVFAPQMRGFGAVVMIDGMRTGITEYGSRARYEQIRNPVGTLEDVEAVEAISGFTGFLNGGGNSTVGGALNFVLKRPTAEYYNRITVGNAGGNQYYVTGDFGGPMPFLDGKFGYRINFLKLDGEASTKGIEFHNRGISVAIDYHVTDDLLFQIDLAHKKFRRDGIKGDIENLFTKENKGLFGDLESLGIPLNRSWGQKWSYYETEIRRFGANLKWDLLDKHLTVRAAYRRQIEDGDYDAAITRFAFPTMELAYDYGYLGASEMLWKTTTKTESGHIFVDAKFDTFFIKHKLTTGFQNFFETITAPSPGNLNYIAHTDPNENRWAILPTWQHPFVPKPDHINQEPNFASIRPHFTSKYYDLAKIAHSDFIIGDEISIGDHVILLVGFNHTNIQQRHFQDGNAPLDQLGSISIVDGKPQKYDKSAWTPNYSIIYKPIKEVSLYGTYIESLERGEFVGNLGSAIDSAGVNHFNVPFRNAGQVFEPAVSKQYELGVKAIVNNSLLLTLAAFKIDKVNYFTTAFPPDSQYAIWTVERAKDGRELHRGIELTATGKVTDRLAIVGGVTWLRATVEKMAPSSVPSDYKPQEGHIKAGIPERTAKLYAEYETPFIDGLFLVGGGFYSGKYHNSASPALDWIWPSSVTYDAGLRFETAIKGVDTTFNLYVTNVTNNYYCQGNFCDPRTVTFSVSAKF